MFRVELFRKNSLTKRERIDFIDELELGRRRDGESSEKGRRKNRHIELNDTQKRILNFLSDDPNLSAVRLAEQLGISSRNVEKNIKKLKEYGILIRHGSPKNGYWEIVVWNLKKKFMEKIMEIKSILIKDTTREERIRIVQEGLNQCGGACDFCNGCDNLGGGSVDAFYEPYINGEKELREINEEYRSNSSLVK